MARMREKKRENPGYSLRTGSLTQGSKKQYSCSFFRATVTADDLFGPETNYGEHIRYADPTK